MKALELQSDLSESDDAFGRNLKTQKEGNSKQIRTVRAGLARNQGSALDAGCLPVITVGAVNGCRSGNQKNYLRGIVRCIGSRGSGLSLHSCEPWQCYPIRKGRTNALPENPGPLHTAKRN